MIMPKCSSNKSFEKWFFFFFLKMIFNVEWGFFIFYFFKWAKGDPLSNLFLQSWCLKVNSIPLARKDLKSLNTCNQICFFILKIFRLSLQRQSKKWNAWESHMLGTSKKGKNPKFEDLKIFENLKICSLERYFLLEANKMSVWSLKNLFLSHLRICEILSFKDIS